MYAIVKTGGKQYKCIPGEKMAIDKIEGEAGSEIQLNDVLMTVDDNNKVEIGRPVIENASVSAVITKQTKGKKIVVFKSKRRKGYRKKTGHRQLLTEITIKEITL